MWPNGFGSNGTFHNNFNQDDFAGSPPFGGGPPGTLLQGQQFFPPNMMLFNNGEGFGGGFQPDIGLFNDGSLMQNQYMGPHPQFSSPQSTVVQAIQQSATPQPVALNGRAAELKAQLMKAKLARQGSSTPPIKKPGLLDTTVYAGSSISLRGSPSIPVTAAEHRDQELNELISEFSAPEPAPSTISQPNLESLTENSASSSHRIPASIQPLVESQAPSLGSPKKAAKPIDKIKRNGIHDKAISNSNGHSKDDSASEMSEGEILDEPSPKKPPTRPQYSKVPAPQQPANEPPIRRTSTNQIAKPPQIRDSRPDIPSSPRREPPSQPRAERRYDERPRSRQGNRTFSSDYRVDQNRTMEGGNEQYRRRVSHDDEGTKPEAKTGPKAASRPEEPRPPPKERLPPTLEDILLHDLDLRLWLDITGYHNTDYRNKILGRRRQLAALDEERKRLLADIEAEERGGIPNAALQTPSKMLPPPTPMKSVESINIDTAQAQPPSNMQTNLIPSSKRSHSNVEVSPNGIPVRAKVARVDEGSQVPRAREEEFENRRPRSDEYGPSRRSSFDRQDERDSPHTRYGDDRYMRGRADSRERGRSPGARSFEDRPPTHARPYDAEDFHQRDDRPSFNMYVGRNYDPDFYNRGGRGARGRGGRIRGKGRGEWYGYNDAKNEPGFGSKSVNGKPKGFDRGGKAGQ